MALNKVGRVSLLALALVACGKNGDPANGAGGGGATAGDGGTTAGGSHAGAPNGGDAAAGEGATNGAGTDAGGQASSDGGSGTSGSGDGGSGDGGQGTNGGMPNGGAGAAAGGTSGGPGGGAAGDGAAGGGAAGGGAAGDGSGGAANTGSTCPSTPPADQSNCTPPWEPGNGAVFGETATAHCSWGDDARRACRTSALCVDGQWQVTAPDAALCGACPGQPPASGDECSEVGSRCDYEDGTACSCSGCVGGDGAPVCQLADPPQWSCTERPSECPFPAPQAGSACDVPGAECGEYCGSPVRCEGGVWQWLDCQSCCPRCAAPDTPIATPAGERPIASLRAGDLVYSVDRGAITAVPLLRVAHKDVTGHHVIRVTLSDGSVIAMSAGHPLADGRTFGELAAGHAFDDAHVVVEAELVPYRDAATYDILPDSSTGTYFAAGAEVGSTLFGEMVRGGF